MSPTTYELFDRLQAQLAEQQEAIQRLELRVLKLEQGQVEKENYDGN